MARPVEWDIQKVWNLYVAIECARRARGLSIAEACRELAKGKGCHWRTLQNRYSKTREKCEQIIRDDAFLIFSPLAGCITETPTFFRDGPTITIAPCPDLFGNTEGDHADRSAGRHRKRTAGNGKRTTVRAPRARPARTADKETPDPEGLRALRRLRSNHRSLGGRSKT
jgi:hypothetical protein